MNVPFSAVAAAMMGSKRVVERILGTTREG